MEPEFWIDRWKKNDIGFHQSAVHDLLQRHWPEVHLKPGSAVLVPLCGNSLDMVWLAEAGHDVFGIELSALAVDQFFARLGLRAAAVQQDYGVLKMGGAYSLLCGDFFAVPPAATAHIKAVYDRAALVAMPPALRGAYAAQLMALTPPGARTLLISLSYEPHQMQGPPFPVPPADVEALFKPFANVRLLEEREVIATHPHFKARGITSLREAAYLLERR